MLRPIAELLDFLENKMSMQAVYQPVIILHLLTRGGVSTRKDLARTLSGYDEMGLDYWDRVLIKNPKLTLVDTHKIINYESEHQIFKLNFVLVDLDTLKKAQRFCEEVILQWIKRALNSQKLDEKEALRNCRVLALAKCESIQEDYLNVDNFEIEEFAMQIAINCLKNKHPDQEIHQQPYNTPGFDILVGSISSPVCYVKLISTRKILSTFQISEYDRQFSIENSDKYALIVIYSIDLSERTYHIKIHHGGIYLSSFLLTPNRWNATLI